MKLNREELANTSFDQINFNEWRLWFFKEFVKICRYNGNTATLYVPHGAVLPALIELPMRSVTDNRPRPCFTTNSSVNARKKELGKQLKFYFDKAEVFPIELQSHYF